MDLQQAFRTMNQRGPSNHGTFYFHHLFKSFKKYDYISIWLVPDFGGWSLETDPNFVQYRHFCGTVINVRTDINPNKMGIQHYLRQRRSSVDRVYLKKYSSWIDIGTIKCIKSIFLIHFSERGLNFLKARIFVNSLKFPVLCDNKFYC